jgi:DNA-binding MarR family transcriptional regulator
VTSTTTPTDPGTAQQRPIGFWLKLVDRLIDDSFDALLGHAGLTRRHWQVLNLLQDAPATVRQVDERLAPFLDAGEPTTRPVLDDLHGRGWIAWTDAGQAALTEAGSAAHADLRQQVANGRARLAAGITPQEYAATIEVLRRMAVNLGWTDSS